VRTLVTTELAGTIEMVAATPADLAEAGITDPAGAGTIVRLEVPVQVEAR
jgi:hypothetical protein